MPAHRSEAEAEIRDAAVAHIRLHRPNARIMHEINIGGGVVRVDVLAVDRAEIIALEVKSEKDTLSRLEKQVSMMRKYAHHTITAMHEKFLADIDEPWDLPKEARGSVCWLYPRPVWPDGAALHRSRRWSEPELYLQTPLPPDTIHILWSDELAWLCWSCGVAVPKRAPMTLMINALRWQVSGGDLTKGICAALRARKCIEADHAIPLTNNGAE